MDKNVYVICWCDENNDHDDDDDVIQFDWHHSKSHFILMKQTSINIGFRIIIIIVIDTAKVFYIKKVSIFIAHILNVNC